MVFALVLFFFFFQKKKFKIPLSMAIINAHNWISGGFLKRQPLLPTRAFLKAKKS